MDIVAVIPGLAGAATAILAYLLTNYFQKKAKQVEKKKRELLKDVYVDSFSNKSARLFDKYIDVTKITPENKLIFYEFKNLWSKNLRNTLAHYTLPAYTTKEEVENVIEDKTRQLEKRLKNIEARFPEKATLDKLESINDAILGTQIDGLTESLQDLRGKMLTKWDVAKVVFAILSAIGVIIGIIFGIISFID